MRVASGTWLGLVAAALPAVAGEPPRVTLRDLLDAVCTPGRVAAAVSAPIRTAARVAYEGFGSPLLIKGFLLRTPERPRRQLGAAFDPGLDIARLEAFDRECRGRCAAALTLRLVAGSAAGAAPGACGDDRLTGAPRPASWTALVTDAVALGRVSIEHAEFEGALEEAGPPR